MLQVSYSRTAASALLVFQVIPLLLFPPSSFSPTSQEWWLPALLAVLVVVADLSLLVRHSHAAWPWHLMSFAQGFNIISRLMLIWPHATVNVGGGATAFNTPYVSLALLSMLLSGFILLNVERADFHQTVTA